MAGSGGQTSGEAQCQTGGADAFDFDLDRAWQTVLQRNGRGGRFVQHQLDADRPVAQLRGHAVDACGEAAVLHPRKSLKRSRAD